MLNTKFAECSLGEAALVAHKRNYAIIFTHLLPLHIAC